jgi:hypothetical protein
MRDFAERAKCCRTENEWNRLHIDLENVLAPQELAQLARHVAMTAAYPRTSAWLNRLHRLLPEVIDAPRNFEGETLHPNLRFYRGATRSEGRHVLLAFTGNTGRMMLPVTVFLQLFDPHHWDVLVIRKQPGQSYYAEGSPLNDIGKTAAGLVSASSYESVACIGTSNGGFAAIAAALTIGAVTGVSVGGKIPSGKAGDDLVARLLPLCGHTTLKYVHGAQCEADARTAHAMALRIPGEVVPVPGVDRHNVLAGILQGNGNIGDLLKRVGLLA